MYQAEGSQLICEHKTVEQIGGCNESTARAGSSNPNTSIKIVISIDKDMANLLIAQE
jgi:hypothetical protein